MPARSSNVLWWTGTLVGLAGLVLLGLETVSSGHVHLVGGHALHHHHFYCGAHEHSEAQPGHQAQSGHDDEGPAPPGHSGRRTATVAAAPAHFQPVVASSLAAPLAVSTPLVPALAPALVVRLVIKPARPRGPPETRIAGKKGNPRCRP